jgi:hypothetical protein
MAPVFFYLFTGACPELNAVGLCTAEGWKEV